MAAWRDYFELMKVRIAGLLMLVALAGYIATSGTQIGANRLGALLIAGFLASTGSSVLNSYVDRDIDLLMDRTRHRALPMRRIHPPQKVLAFGALLVAGGLIVAWFLDNPLTAGFIALGVATYLGVSRARGLRRCDRVRVAPGRPHRPPRVSLDAGALLGPRVPPAG